MPLKAEARIGIHDGGNAESRANGAEEYVSTRGYSWRSKTLKVLGGHALRAIEMQPCGRDVADKYEGHAAVAEGGRVVVAIREGRAKRAEVDDGVACRDACVDRIARGTSKGA